ncbi:MAG: RNA polymerase Rpb6 [Flavobacteriaceae bacterium]|nr:RNA polymerase Rpb6 [Flavobacteriaceae bacterium]
MAKIPQYPGIPTTTVARDLRMLDKDTNNLYEAIAIIAKRANQVSAMLKEQINNELEAIGGHESDNLEEVHENREQIELSMQFERLPKATVIATEEFIAGKVYHRNPAGTNDIV